MVAITDAKQQKEFIKQCISTSMEAGQAWYLVDAKWFKQWKRYVGFDHWDMNMAGDSSCVPGPIDNSAILKEDGTLKDHLIDDLDYTLLTEEAWHKMLEWYGSLPDQPEIKRQVIVQGKFVQNCKVEVYLMEIMLAKYPDISRTVSRRFSRMDSIGQVEKVMREVFKIPSTTVCRLWNAMMASSSEVLDKKEVTLQDTTLFSGQTLIIEVQNSDGSWPKASASGANTTSQPGKSTATTTTTSSSNLNRNASGGTRFNNMNKYNNSSGPFETSSPSYSGFGMDGIRGISKPGVCGLSNLGNTCFMNSALQCMSNVPQLTKYFLADTWSGELNPDNPLGMHGEIAKSYAELISTIWSGSVSYTVPRSFKIAVGRFAPQFSGFQQQDSQELMAFLLDGLHEDLNRIKKKPYVEVKESNGRPDEDVAREAWHNYKLRNDSIIVDTFHGLLKSTLVCPEESCKKVSVTFDPFCYLSLPLPQERNRLMEVTLVTRPGPDPDAHAPKPIRYKLLVPKEGVIRDLFLALEKLTNHSPDKLVAVDLYNHRFHKIFTPDDTLIRIQDRDEIYVYEVTATSWTDPNILLVPLYMREKSVSSWTLFGDPLILSLKRQNCTYRTAYEEALRCMARYVNLPDPDPRGPDGRWWRDGAAGGGGRTAVDEGIEDEEASDQNEPMEERPPLFNLKEVNSWGSTELNNPPDLDAKLVHTPKPTPSYSYNTNSSPSVLYLSADWHPEARRRFLSQPEMMSKDSHESMNRRLDARRQVPLSECLDLFTTTETLGKDDLWYCPVCKKHQQASKKFDLWDLPNILVIHLKRFSYDRYLRSKIDCEVKFPMKGLDLSKWVLNKSAKKRPEYCYYDLLSVSNHYGGLGGGHYTAYAQNYQDKKWRYFDDNSVSDVHDNNEPSAKAGKSGYVLVYARSCDSESNGTAGSPAASLSAMNGNLAAGGDDDEEDYYMDVS